MALIFIQMAVLNTIVQCTYILSNYMKTLFIYTACPRKIKKTLILLIDKIYLYIRNINRYCVPKNLF